MMLGISDEKIRIAIIDDNYDARRLASIEVRDAGYDYFFPDSVPQEVSDMAYLIKQNASGALCDHRLAFGSYASFQGAELVAFLYDIGFPALLVTQYSEIDADVSIRKWRKKIPTLISREEMSAESIKIGFEKCLSELRGTKNTERIAHRTLLRVTGREYESGEEVVDVVIPGWNPQKAVRFPLSLINSDIRDKVQLECRLFAHINIGANDSEDLFFENFEIAPELQDE